MHLFFQRKNFESIFTEGICGKELSLLGGLTNLNKIRRFH